MSDLMEMTALEMRAAMECGEVTSRQLVGASFDRIAALDERVHAFISLRHDDALAEAEAIDSRRAAGESAAKLGPLAGIPIAIKDNLCTRDGLATTCGSKMLENFRAPYDAHVVQKLRAAGAIIVGKCNLDEFAMGSSTENSGFGPTRNPWNLECVPGGSSGGSAACVASRMVPMAVGSDTGGSIRQPGSLCGVIGMKPTYGRVSRYGLIAFASSLDQIGPFTRTVDDAALLLGVLSGPDSRDSTCLDHPVPDYLAGLEQVDFKNLRIGVPGEFFGQGLDAEVEKAVRRAIKIYEDAGATLVEVDLPHSAYAVETYYIVATAECSSNLARYDGVHYGHRSTAEAGMIDMYEHSRAEGFGDEVKRRVMLGTHVLSSGYYDAYYLTALKVRQKIKQDFDQAFAKVDCIMGPTSPSPAFLFGARTDDPLSMYLSDIYTISANLATIPGISVPCGHTESGLPIGLQIMSDVFTEDRLLGIARLIQESRQDYRRRPPILESN